MSKPGLIDVLADTARTVVGLRREREVFDAAMARVARSRARAIVLRRHGDDPELRIVSQSMGGVITQTLRSVTGVLPGELRVPLARARTIAAALAGSARGGWSVRALCDEVFGDAAAPRVAGLLGGADGAAAAVPIRSGGEVVAVLAVGAAASETDLDQACETLAAIIGNALTLARIIQRVEGIRAQLPPNDPAVAELASALEVAPGTEASAPWGGSLVPYRLLRTTAPPPPESLASPTSSAETGPGEAGEARARVLLVEDERRIRESTSALLSGLGYRVTGVASGEEAVAAFSRARDVGAPFDVVLLDETLGGQMRGTEALRILQTLQEGVQAIQLSGMSDKSTPGEPQRHGFAKRLNKPVSLEVLSAAIEEILHPR